jgi:hypothetical protein
MEGDPRVKESLSLDNVQSDVLRFLASPAITNGDGCVYSWINPEHPGFIYPESMGLYLRLMSFLAAERRDPVLTERAHTIASSLQKLLPPSGGVGMEGRLYLFDTCMALAGLSAYRRLLKGRIDEGKLRLMARFIGDMTERRVTLVEADGRVPEVRRHWSTIFGAHQLKTVIALDCLATDLADGKYLQMALGVADEVVKGCYDDGIFRFGPGEKTVYCHAHCYALEGLLYLRERGYRDTTAMLRAGADALRGWQNDDGSMNNWYEDPSKTPSRVGDASAQAVRLWIAVDRERYRASIDRGLEFLAGLRSPESGLYYSKGSRDVNSVTSIFATQAMEWALRGPRPEWLV